ncbi:MAG: hypothetical protein ACO3T7_15530, partial [Pseudomonadales bacterium]
ITWLVILKTRLWLRLRLKGTKQRLCRSPSGLLHVFKKGQYLYWPFFISADFSDYFAAFV